MTVRFTVSITAFSTFVFISVFFFLLHLVPQRPSANGRITVCGINRPGALSL
jgi:hypothetical protein